MSPDTLGSPMDGEPRRIGALSMFRQHGKTGLLQETFQMAFSGELQMVRQIEKARELARIVEIAAVAGFDEHVTARQQTALHLLQESPGMGKVGKYVDEGDDVIAVRYL